VGVIGSPIQHSLSPQLHAAGFAYLGLEGTSERVQADEVHAGLIRDIMGTRFDALSLTMPLKAVAATMCDDLDERARSLGVVNSLLWRDDKLCGASTDGPGFIDAVNAEFAVTTQNMHVVVIGSGGAARAIIDALVHEGVASISLLGRNHVAIAELMQRYAQVLDYSLIYRPIDLIVNTTPSHTRQPDTAVIQGVTRDTIAVDITYDPAISPWLALHADLRCRHANGMAMLAYTVARQMTWWCEREVPGAVLLSALSEVLG
jgi:shikimate dehydrogenase